MKIVADTNVLLRITMLDDESQARIATDTLKNAEAIAITLPTLCEFCWTLTRSYKKRPQDVAAAVRQWIKVRGVKLDRNAVDVGLEMLDAGGDFADGVIAHDGLKLGGDTLVTFDRDAARLLERQQRQVLLLPST